MSFSSPATGEGPEADDRLEIPGFPKPHKPDGFAGNLQVCGAGAHHVHTASIESEKKCRSQVLERHTTCMHVSPLVH